MNFNELMMIDLEVRIYYFLTEEADITWKKVVDKDLRSLHLNSEDAGGL